jgi:hypothetical protein
MDALIDQPIAASALARDEVPRILPSTFGGFAPEQHKDLSDYGGPIKSLHSSEEVVEDEESRRQS